MTRQQHANETLAVWQALRDLAPQDRLRKLDEYEAKLRAVEEAMRHA